MNLSFREKIIYGAILLGIGFPIMGIFITLNDLDISFSISNLIAIHKKVPSLFLIDLAPIVLPTVAVVVTKLAKQETETAVKENVRENLKSISGCIDELKNENYTISCEMDGATRDIGNSLSLLKEKLIFSRDSEKNRLWSGQVLTRIGETLRNNNEDIEQLSKVVIKELVKDLGAHYGGIYILDDSRKVHKLKLTGSYAFDFKAREDQSFEIGEGLVGQCHKGKELIKVDDIPDEFKYEIESGLGSSPPKCIVYSPLLVNDNCIGVLELASLKEIENHKTELVDKLSESIAVSVHNVKNGQQTKDLLEESQFMAQQLQAQEEELRQNAEELQATQEEIERKLSETEEVLSAERKKINSIISTSLDGIIVLSERGKLLDFNPAFEELVQYTNSELKKLSLKKILNLEKETTEFIEENLGNVTELQIETKKGDEIWIKVSTNKMEIENEINYSMFVSDITEDKHNLSVMEESVNEFQNMMMEQMESQGALQMEIEMLKQQLEDLNNND